jgi:hypothetical protein
LQDKSDYMRAAHNAVNPNGSDALDSSLKELEKIGASLQEVVVFWDDHYGRIRRYAPQESTSRVLSEYGMSATIKVWDDYEPLLQDGIKSIRLSSDMVLVDAVPMGRRQVPQKAPQNPPRQATSTQPPKKLGFFQKFISIFTGRR